MKLVIALALLGVALASLHSSSGSRIRSQWFEDDKQYVWQYDAQLTTGLPVSKSQQAAQRIQTRVNLQIRDNTAYVQLQKPTLYWSDRALAQTSRLVDVKSFQPIDLERKQVEELGLPLHFRYENGMVSELEFDQEDPVWSQNIKRAVVNMLQININNSGKMTRFEEEEDESTEKMNKNFFTAEETTIEGICEVSYTKTTEKNEVVVTKAVNFEKCSKRVDMRYNMPTGNQCSDCNEPKLNKEQSEQESQTVMRFRISGSEDRFLIREVDLNSKYVFSPLSTEQELVATEIVNKLVLVESGDIETRMPKITSEKKSTLVYNQQVQKAREMWEMTGEEKYLEKMDLPKMNKVEVVKKLLAQVSRMFSEKNGVEIENTHNFARLVELLRLATKGELVKIQNFVNEKSDDNKVYRQMFVDALSVSGTKTTVSFLVEEIVSERIPATKAALLMKNLVNVRVPSEQIVDELVKLAKDSVSERNPVLAQSTKLTIGSMMYRTCGVTENKYAVEQREMCPRELKEKFVQTLRKMWTSSESRYEKVLALKVAANAGLDLGVSDLEKVIYNKKEDKTVRLQAIDSLRQLRTVMPRKIQNILMPVYKSRSEDPEVRMTALYHLVQTLPERFTLEQLVQQINTERNPQVAAFTYRLLKSFVQSENPCEKSFSDRVEVALRMVEKKNFDTSSRYYTLPLYYNHWMTGVSFDVATLFTNESIVPKQVMASFDSLLGGKWSKQMSVFGMQQNLDKVLLKAFERIEKTESLDEIVVRGKRSVLYRPIDMLRGLAEKLSLTARRHMNNEEEAHATLYFRYQNFDYAVIPMNEEIVYDLVKNVLVGGKLDISEMERVLAKGVQFETQISGFLYEMSREVATTFGLPLKLTSKMPTVASVEGKVVAELEPKRGNSIKGLKVRLVAKPTVASTNIVHVQVVAPFVHTGMKLQHSAQVNLPVDATLSMDWINKFQSTFSFKIPTTEQRLLKVQSRPAVFVREVTESSENQYTEPKEKTIYLEKYNRLNKEIDTAFGKSVAGVDFVVSGNYYNNLFDTEELSYLTTDNLLEVRVFPTSESPREIKWTVEADLFQKDQELETREFDRFYSSLQKNFETEKSEYANEEESDRRDQFKNYLKNVDVKSATKHRVFMKVQTVGSESDLEKKAQVELQLTCDDKYRSCKLSSEVQRSPLSGERRQWTMKSNVQTLFPETPASIKDLFEQLHREFVAVVESEWGVDRESTVTLKIQGEQNREMKKWMKINKNAIKTDYGYLKEAAQLNQYKVQADYKLEKTSQKNVERLFQLLKVWKMWNTEVEVAENQEGRVFAQLSIEPESRRYANLTVETPSERVRMLDVQLPYRMPLLNIVRPSKLGQKLASSVRAECQVRSNQVRTFDDLLYKTPITTCYSVVAKDCSENPSFAVLVKKVSKNGDEKKVKIVDQERVIELVKSENEMVVKVDGKTVSEKQWAKYQITQLADSVYEIELEQALVNFDGYTLNVELSHMLQNRQCGLCGHFDGQKDNEFRRADNEETDDIEEFHRTYLIRDEECEVEEQKLRQKSNHQVIEESSSSEEDEDESPVFGKSEKRESENGNTKPERRTRVAEFSHRVCFSKHPVPTCVEGERDETEQMKVRFTCFDRSTQEAHKLIKLVRREVLELSSRPDSYVETLTVPRTCSVY